MSEKIEKHANNALVDDEITFKELWEMDDTDAVELQEEAKINAWRILVIS